MPKKCTFITHTRIHEEVKRVKMKLGLDFKKEVGEYLTTRASFKMTPVRKRGTRGKWEEAFTSEIEIH